MHSGNEYRKPAMSIEDTSYQLTHCHSATCHDDTRANCISTDSAYIGARPLLYDQMPTKNISLTRRRLADQYAMRLISTLWGISPDCLWIPTSLHNTVISLAPRWAEWYKMPLMYSTTTTLGIYLISRSAQHAGDQSLTSGKGTSPVLGKRNDSTHFPRHAVRSPWAGPIERIAVNYMLWGVC